MVAIKKSKIQHGLTLPHWRARYNKDLHSHIEGGRTTRPDTMRSIGEFFIKIYLRRTKVIQEDINMRV